MKEFIEIPVNNQSAVMRKLVFGVGINDADYIVNPIIHGKKAWCPYYRTWSDMLKRCYSDKFKDKNHTYRGCTVSTEWLTFSVFKEWMNTQDWKGNQLDKDILVIGNKEYGKAACAFVSHDVNKLLGDSAAKRGKYPLGVGFHAQSGKYISQCGAYGKLKYLGLFEVLDDAEQAYLEYKSYLIEKVAKTQKEEVRLGLIRHAELIKTKLNK